MKTYIADIIPRIKQFSKKLDDLTLLENQHWVIIDETTQTKQVFIFRKNSELLIATDGKVQKGKWEYLNNDSILIEKQEEMFLLKHGFLDNEILSLKLDSRNEFAFFVNETKYGDDLNDIESIQEFLRAKYLSQTSERLQQVTESFVSSKPLDGHTCPPSKRTHVDTIMGTWEQIERFRIDYRGGLNGFLNQAASGKTSFEDSNGQAKFYYKRFDSAITAMYVYKTHNILLTTDYLKTES